MKLKPNCELVDNLSGFKFKDDHVKLVFTIVPEVEPPQHAFADTQLKAIQGKRVGILNINDQFFVHEM